MTDSDIKTFEYEADLQAEKACRKAMKLIYKESHKIQDCELKRARANLEEQRHFHMDAWTYAKSKYNKYSFGSVTKKK